ncbi:MAG: hypothetical protein ACTTI3_08915, partial [Treponema sp.]
QVAGYNKPHKIKVAKDLVNEELAAELLKELLKVLKDDATIAKDCMLYKEEAGKTPLTKKNTDELKDGGTVYFGKRNDKEAKDVKLTISSVEGTPSVGGKSFKAVTTDDLKGTAQDHHLGLLVGRTVSDDKVAAEIKALIVANIAPEADIGEGKNKFRFFNKKNPSDAGDIVALDALAMAGSIGKGFFVGIQTVD